MATRLYLPSTGAAAVSPAFGAWDATSEADRLKMVTTRISSAMAIKSITESLTAIDGKSLWRQYVSDPIPAQTITGTIKGQLRTSEENALLNHDRVTIIVKVVSNDGATLRGTLLTLGFYGATNEYTLETTRTNRKIADGDALSSVVAQANDRIVIEIGTQPSTIPLATDELVNAVFGDDSGTDLAEDESTTAANNPWIEFSQDLFTLISNGPLVDSVLEATPGHAGVGAAPADALAQVEPGGISAGAEGASMISGIPEGGVAENVVGSYAPDTPTSLANGQDVYVLRASGNQGDLDDNTGTTAVTPASWPTGTGTLVLATQTLNDQYRPAWPISHVVFGARALLSADNAGYLSNPRITGWGGSAALSPMFPIIVPYTGTSGRPEDVREARSAPVATCPATGLPWTWIDVEAIVQLILNVDHSNITTVGHFAEGYGTEMWVEAYGPQGSFPDVIRLKHTVGKIVREQEVKTTL